MKKKKPSPVNGQPGRPTTDEPGAAVKVKSKKKLTPAILGVICVVAAFAANGLQPPSDNDSEKLGRSIGTAAFVFVGVVLIIVHFILKKHKTRANGSTLQ